MSQTATSEQEPAFIEVGEGRGARRIAVRARAGSNPGLFWLGGFKSDMTGTKAIALDAWAAEHGRSSKLFDVPGLVRDLEAGFERLALAARGR